MPRHASHICLPWCHAEGAFSSQDAPSYLPPSWYMTHFFLLLSSSAQPAMPCLCSSHKTFSYAFSSRKMPYFWFPTYHIFLSQPYKKDTCFLTSLYDICVSVQARGACACVWEKHIHDDIYTLFSFLSPPHIKRYFDTSGRWKGGGATCLPPAPCHIRLERHYMTLLLYYITWGGYTRLRAIILTPPPLTTPHLLPTLAFSHTRSAKSGGCHWEKFIASLSLTCHY